MYFNITQPDVSRMHLYRTFFFSLQATIWLFSILPVTVCVHHLHTVSPGFFPATSSVIRPFCGLAALRLQQLAAWPPGRGPLASGPLRLAKCCGVPQGHSGILQATLQQRKTQCLLARPLPVRAAHCDSADAVLFGFLSSHSLLKILSGNTSWILSHMRSG